MKKDSEYIIEDNPKTKKKRAIAHSALFLFSFAFFFGIAVLVWTTWPVIYSIYVQQTTKSLERVVQLPENQNRTIPFKSPDPNIIIKPYPSEELGASGDVAGGDSGRIRIPAIGVDVPVVESPSLEDADILTTLNKGAALYPNGITPGAIGNTFISAHSTGEPWKGAYRFAFIKINELKAGDVLYLDWKGARYTYRITKRDIITPTPDFRVVSDRPVPTLSLMACYPLWSTKQRMLIHADLTNITQLTKPSLSVSRASY